jgi:hypothetical protein
MKDHSWRPSSQQQQQQQQQHDSADEEMGRVGVSSSSSSVNGAKGSMRPSTPLSPPSPDTVRRNGRLALLSMLLLVFQGTALSIMLRYSRARAGQAYLASVSGESCAAHCTHSAGESGVHCGCQGASHFCPHLTPPSSRALSPLGPRMHACLHSLQSS